MGRRSGTITPKRYWPAGGKSLPVPNIPTVITIVRLLLVPVVGYLIAQGRYGAAAAVFVAAAVSDLADGAIARRFALVSELGARLDAVADKVLMVTAALALAWQGLLPLWLVAAIVVRDAVVSCAARSPTAAWWGASRWRRRSSSRSTRGWRSLSFRPSGVSI